MLIFIYPHFQLFTYLLMNKQVLKIWLTFGMVFVTTTFVGLLSNFTTLHNLFQTETSSSNRINTKIFNQPISRSLSGHDHNSTTPTTATNTTLQCHSNIGADPLQLQSVGSAIVYIFGICIVGLISSFP